MKVELIEVAWQEGKEIELFVDGIREAYFTDSIPKQSNLKQNFCDVYLIPKLMKLAHLAGQKGESFDVVRRNFQSYELQLQLIDKKYVHDVS